MEWYRIQEINYVKFVDCLSDIYKVLEKRNKSECIEDVFLKSTLIGFSSLSDNQWRLLERARKSQKALEMTMGTFHQRLAGCFDGWESLPAGGKGTGLDVRKKDDSEIMEWKNKHNTMNADSAKSVIQKLTRQISNGKRAFLVMVNCGRTIPRFNAPLEITVMNGMQAYEYLAGRSSFFDDLNLTLSHVFANYKTYAELKATVETL